MNRMTCNTHQIPRTLTKNLLTKSSEMDRSRAHFPYAVVRNTLATQSTRNDLVAEADALQTMSCVASSSTETADL